MTQFPLRPFLFAALGRTGTFHRIATTFCGDSLKVGTLVGGRLCRRSERSVSPAIKRPKGATDCPPSDIDASSRVPFLIRRSGMQNRRTGFAVVSLSAMKF